MSAAVLLTFLGVSPVVAGGVAGASPSDTATQSGGESGQTSDASSASDDRAADDRAADDSAADDSAVDHASTDGDSGEEASREEDGELGDDTAEADDATEEEIDEAVEVGDQPADDVAGSAAAERSADRAFADQAVDDMAAPDPDNAARRQSRSVEGIGDGAAAESGRGAEPTLNAGNLAAPDTADAPAGKADDFDPAAESTAAAPPRSMRTIVSARPVTVQSIVTDVLTWVGLGPVARGLPVPATPVSALVQSLWLAVRQAQYTFNNQRPTADVTVSGPGPDGVVSGALNAVDYDDLSLTYTLTAAPTNGRVLLDSSGGFTYTPEVPGRADQFTVMVDDTVGNPFHVHGLLGLLGLTGPTEVVVTIDASSARPAALRPIGLDDLLDRDGVTVSLGDGSTATVIDGRFTEQSVTDAVEAALVMNALAPALGAVPGFVTASELRVDRAGTGSAAEHFYRYTETRDGITVLGSDVILVTDADGAVTSLFSNYVGLADGFDVVPDATLDDDSEVWLLAAAEYLGAGADGVAVDDFLTRNTFVTALVIYALDEQVDPALAWQVEVRFPDTGDMSASATTYVIDADGNDAGTIIVSVTPVHGYSVTTVGTDRLGDSRTITVDRGGWLFPSYSLLDDARSITTYSTSYSWFGFGGPVLPGRVVKRGWFGWNTGAVSAHANTAVTYDYFEDVLGRTSFDNAGAHVTVSIRYNPVSPYLGAGYANAFWDPTRQQFAFGDAGYLQASLDVVAHEFTHAVVSYVVGTGGSVLNYGESGALNEAYADIMGLLVEGKSGTDRWLIGEDSDYGIIRNLADPSSVRTGVGPYRDHYDTRYTGTGDDGGEHVNSTIFGHAAYLMMTDAATAGVSDEAWARVFYHSLFRLGRSAVFADGRAAVLSAAAAQGFSADQLDAIRSAFDDVGIVGPAESALLVA